VCEKRPKQQVHTLTLEEMNQQELTDDILLQLEQEDAVAQDLFYLSMNAVTTKTKDNTIRLRALVKNKVMLTLVDSGSSHSFVSAALVKQLGLTTQQVALSHVKVADGSILPSSEIVPGLEWWIQGHTFKTDMRVLDLATHDAILGYDWLEPRSPMDCHWKDKTMAWVENGVPIKLQGIVPQHTLQINEMSAEQFLKWTVGNDIWACAIVEHQQHSPAVHPAVQHLLYEFQDLFAAPTKLPPPRVYDHTIPLVPGATPVNSRPYRYSPAHKDEIEKQVQELFTLSTEKRWLMEVLCGLQKTQLSNFEEQISLTCY
jgi:hypothetical protein